MDSSDDSVQAHDYAVEDWLVHAFYGLGQIVDVEVKDISGADVSYSRIQTTDSTFWVPVDQMDSEKTRPIASREDIETAITVLKRPPREMSADHKARKSRMQRVRLQNMPEDLARLLRDMRARHQTTGSYNMDEKELIRTLKERLIEEWAVVMDTNPEQIAAMIDDLLDREESITTSQQKD